MKLIGLLCWYNESPTWLAATVSSLSKIGVDHLIAVDGAYALFPNRRPRSPITEVEAIVTAADAIGIGLTLDRPKDVWVNGESDKRSYLFSLAETIGTPGEDWTFVIDADEVVSEGTPRVKEELEATDCHSAYGRLEQWWPDVMEETKKAEIARMFPHPTIIGENQTRYFRILKHMRVDTTHFTYVGDWNGVSYSLRGDKSGERLGYTSCKILDPMRVTRIEHRDPMRDATRKLDKKAYYEDRDRTGIERIRELCDPPAFELDEQTKSIVAS